MCISKFHKSSRVSRRVSTLRLVCLIAVLASVLVASGCTTGPFRGMFQEQKPGITKGPVLLGVYKDRAALMWETETEGPCKLYYGRDQKLEEYIESTPEMIQYEAKEEDDNEAVKKTAYIHKVWLKNLETGRYYYYSVTGLEFEDKIYRFRTVPVHTDEVRFIVYGDSRTHPNIHRRLVRLMKKLRVDFVVHSGDLVSKGDNYEQWGPQFFEPLKGFAETVPIYIAKGNHEGNNGNFEKLLIPEGQKNSFCFDYGPLHYFCADNVSKGLKDEEQLKLIIDDAESSGAKWKFVSYHIPSLNFGGHWSDWGHPDVLPSLAKTGVDFVIVGHSHQYERFRPVAPPGQIIGNHVTYITSGGGGAPLYDIKPNVYHAEAKKTHHFCFFKIKGNKLTMSAVNSHGKIIDHIEINKTTGRLNKQYLHAAVPMEAVQFRQNLHRALKETLPDKPQKNKPFTITYKLSTSELPEQCRLTLKFRCEKGTYKLPEPKTLTIPKAGGTVQAEFTITPLATVRVPRAKSNKEKPIIPELLLECHYEIGQIQETFSQPIVVKAEK